jgi:hypothetical protein
MSAPTSPRAPAAARSNRRLLLLLAALVVPPVVLVLGPFRGVFFSSRTGAIQRLARSFEPPLTVATIATLAGPKWTRPECEQLQALYAAHAFDALVSELEAQLPERESPGILYLHGLAALAVHRPTVAAGVLTDALANCDAALKPDVEFALAQSLLAIGNADAAREPLNALAGAPGSHRDDAVAQLASLAAIR